MSDMRHGDPSIYSRPLNLAVLNLDTFPEPSVTVKTKELKSSLGRFPGSTQCLPSLRLLLCAFDFDVGCLVFLDARYSQVTLYLASFSAHPGNCLSGLCTI